LLDGATSPADLGTAFGGGLYAREVDWLVREEWAVDPEDILWRRTKCGLHMTAAERAAFAEHMAGYTAASRSG
jgi:glycerol-3-phosphate dehydrogenase